MAEKIVKKKRGPATNPKNKITRPCQQCGALFERWRTLMVGTDHPRLYCSRGCYILHQRRPLEERFWECVAKSDDGCWLWAGHCSTDGYGAFPINSRNFRAHRFMWVLVHGAIPKGMCVLHHCDVRPCVMPDHLFLGTRRDNNEDRDRKGRANHYSKLTTAQVLDIRSRWQPHVRGLTLEISREFGITKTTVLSIIKRGIWKHI